MCAEVSDNQFNITFLASSSNTLQWVNFQDLDNHDIDEQCLFNTSPSETCYQGRVPAYSVNVTTVEDIQVTVLFVLKYNLHLVVKNTGHEMMGRSFGVGSIELFMHNLKSIKFSSSYVPLDAPQSEAGQPAVTIGAGVQWGELYYAAEQHNCSVVGGLVPLGTVGAGGGWPLGGGHGPLSPFYGLGVDNILEITVVLPNASHVTANSYLNPDLFWALRGGGGPSFGIVTSITYKTHPNPRYTAAFYIAIANSSYSYHRLLSLWSEYHVEFADAGWAGTWPFGNSTLSLTLLAQGTPPYNPSADSVLEAFYSSSRDINGVEVRLSISVPYPSFYAWFYDNLVNGSAGFGTNYASVNQGGIPLAVSSWLLPRDVFISNASYLAGIYANWPSADPFLVGGGAVSQVDPDSSSVTPAWRTTISDIVLTTTWQEGSNLSVIQAARQSVHDQLQPLRELAPVPAGGQYINEPDILETSWQDSYWGRHYPRLLSIKKAIDPYDLLIVRKGVNSELWDDEVVCKTV